MSRLLFLFLFIANTLFAAQQYGNVFVDEVTSIYDGDTFRVSIKDYPAIIGNRVAIRVNGIDTPEIRAKCKKEKLLARKAKQFTVNFLRTSKVIELRNIQRGKYFRIVADVYGDGVNLTTELIKHKLGVAYDGGKKSKNWCN